METIDFGKTHKDLYSATLKVKEVVVDEASFLAFDGQGSPAGDAFHKAIEAVFSAAYTMKFALKLAGVVDFKVSKVETLYLDDPAQVPDMSQWHWRVLMRVPDAVTRQHLDEARTRVRETKGLDTSTVALIRWKEGRCLQTMHVGPYDEVTRGYERLGAEAERLSLRLTAPAHEIYMNDPQRTAPERLKTIVRMSVAG